MDILKENILKYRKENQMTQNDLADKLKVSPSSISKWETGKSSPDISLLIPLANAFNISVDQLLSFNINMDEDKRNQLKNDVSQLILNSDYKKGIDLIDKSIAKYPNDMKLHLMKSQMIQIYAPIYLEENELLIEYKEAFNLLDGIINSRDVYYHNISKFIKASLLLELENTDEAEILIEDIFKQSMDPSFLQIKVYELNEDREKLDIFSKSKLLYYINNCISLLNILSRNEMKLDNRNKSLFYLDSAVKLEEIFDINLYNSHYNLARLYYDNKDYKNSSKYFYRFTKNIVDYHYNYDSHNYFSGLKLVSNEDEQQSLISMMRKRILEEFNHEELYDYEEYILGRNILKNI